MSVVYLNYVRRVKMDNIPNLNLLPTFRKSDLKSIIY